LPVVQSGFWEALWGVPLIGLSMQTRETHPASREFTGFANQYEPALRHSLVAHLGYQAGREATQDALVYAWEHWDQLQTTQNPGGYLFRVAKRRALRRRRPSREMPVDRPDDELPWVEPGLEAALQRLSARQRAVVFLVEGLDLSYQETADRLNISRSTVQTHLERAMTRLRNELGVANV